MNIIVKTHQGSLCCRPDTTWERENKDFYSPDFVDCLHWTPVIFARISKAGKYIGEKFAGRYTDAFNFGVLLYSGDILKSGGLATASILDHSSILPSPLYQYGVIETEEEKEVCFSIDGETVFQSSTDGYKDLILKSICEASKYISLRIGDMVAVELAAPAELLGRENEEKEISGKFCGNEVFRFKAVI